MTNHPHQNLFEALQRVCDFTALQTEMQEIIDAVHKDERGVDLFGESIPKPDTIYFKACTTKQDDGWMMCYCGNSGMDNNDHYVVTTEHLKADEVPDLCCDAKTFSDLVAKLLNNYYNNKS